MAIEIDAPELIAYYAILHSDEDRIIISYDSIRKLSAKLEELYRNVLTYCDMVSIDSFRCAFPKHVKMNELELEIENFKSIQSRIERLMPSDEVIEMINQINIDKFNEEDS